MLETLSKEWIEAGALLVAMIVAWTGLRTAKTAEKAAEAQLDAVHATVLSQSIDDYQRLGRDMEALIHWYHECIQKEASFVEIYANERESVDHISGARRNVRLYFQKCAQLLSAGTITRQVFHVMVHKGGLNTLHRIVVPLEQLKQNESFFDDHPEMRVYLEPQYHKHGDGLFTFERHPGWLQARA